MHAIQVETFGPPSVLRLKEIPDPVPNEGEVLIHVHAIGVNPVDTYLRSGTYPVLPELPFTPGLDVAGTVKACGKRVDSFHPGDRVYSSSSRSGGYAQYSVSNSKRVFRLPDTISFQQGAALGVPATTAWRALFTRGQALAGEKLFIHGASGSVGLSALQFACALDMEICGTAGTPEGIKKLYELGMVRAWNHHQAGYIDAIRNYLGSSGFDLILEMFANRNLENDLSFLAPRGRVVVIGSRGRIEIDPRATMGKETDIRGLSLFNSTDEEFKTANAAIFDALRSGVLNPVISRILPLGKAAEAHELVIESGNIGKIILEP